MTLTHDYLKKNDLSRETRWRNFTQDVEVRHDAHQAEPEEEVEDGYEL